MLNTRHFEIFMLVCDEGSMTAASKKLHISQPAISQTIKEIEDTYKTQVFERYGSKLYVTQTGKKLYEYSRRILNIYNEMNTEIYNGDTIDEIRVGGNISVGASQMIQFIKKFNAIHPDIQVRVMIYQATILINALRSNQLDVAMIEEKKCDSGDITMTPYYDDRITVIAPTDHPLAGKTVSFNEICSESFIFRERGSGVRNLFDHILRTKNKSVEVAWECSSTSTIVDAVKEHMGIAVVPYLLVKKHLDEGTISEIFLNDVSLSRKLCVATHKDKVITKPMQDFIDIVMSMKTDE
ncbi:MAG: LysR family transcriptional regulator [Lachnospiraceae bacterium]|jgi:DNA-binding transcriptional LysR family regulator